MKTPLSFAEVKAIGGDLVVKLGKMDEKIRVMKKKAGLRNLQIWISEDYTLRKKIVQEYIEELAVWQIQRREGKRNLTEHSHRRSFLYMERADGVT